jgi:hypothetical protein
MGVEEAKAQIEFERQVRVGREYIAYWQNSHHYYSTRVKLLVINKQSYRVEVVEPTEGYPKGWKLNIPKYMNYMRFTWNQRLAPIEEGTK